MSTHAHERHVGDDWINDAHVSTVFLSLDHAHFGGPPLLFETMVFGGALDGEQVRYSTMGAAASGHKAMCERVRESIAPLTPQ